MLHSDITSTLLQTSYDGLLIRLGNWVPNPASVSPGQDWKQYCEALSLFGRLPTWNIGAQAYIAHQDGAFDFKINPLPYDYEDGRLKADYLANAAKRFVGFSTGARWKDYDSNSTIIDEDNNWQADVYWSLFAPKSVDLATQDFSFYIYGSSVNKLKIYGYTSTDQASIKPFTQFPYGKNRYPFPGERLAINERTAQSWATGRWKYGDIMSCANGIVWTMFTDNPTTIELDKQIDFEDQIDTIWSEDQAILTITPWAEEMKSWFPQGTHIQYNGIEFSLGEKE